MWDISPEVFAYILTAILVLLSLFFGKKYSAAEKKLVGVTNLAKELAEALKATSEAIEDKYVKKRQKRSLRNGKM